MSWRIVRGDCVEQLQGLEDCSVDAICTDPPYGLEFMGKDWDRLDVARANRGTQPARKRPLGETGESPKFNLPAPAFDLSASSQRAMQDWHEAWAAECLRVLKPGGHLLAFGGTRTYHRLAAGVEDAGFEIRDTICWLYGSGFPKSLDVSKAIDKRGGNAHLAGEIASAIRAAREARGWTAGQADKHFCGGSTNWTWYEGRKGVCRPPTPDDFARIVKEWPELEPLADVVAEAERQKIGDGTSGPKAIWADGGMGEFDITAPATPEAERWQGWGTALKPAHEPIMVARKPLAGTVAQTVLEHGTGALNVDGCRIGYQGEADRTKSARTGEYDAYDGGDTATEALGSTLLHGEQHASGRWPANVVLSHTEECREVGTRKVKPGNGSGRASAKSRGFQTEYVGGEAKDIGLPESGFVGADGTETITAWSCSSDCPVRLLDEQTGELTSGSRAEGVRKGLGYHGAEGDGGPAIVGDSGGASRFYFCAKSSRRERNAGLEGFEEQESRRHGDRAPGELTHPSGALKQSGQGAVRSQNVHPTVKPVELMRWLVRLVTPPGGLICDPFAGSGTTGCAAVLESFDFVGIEQDESYADIAEARIAWWEKHRGDGQAAAVLAAGEVRDAVEATGQLELGDGEAA